MSGCVGQATAVLCFASTDTGGCFLCFLTSRILPHLAAGHAYFVAALCNNLQKSDQVMVRVYVRLVPVCLHSVPLQQFAIFSSSPGSRLGVYLVLLCLHSVPAVLSCVELLLFCFSGSTMPF